MACTGAETSAPGGDPSGIAGDAAADPQSPAPKGNADASGNTAADRSPSAPKDGGGPTGVLGDGTGLRAEYFDDESFLAGKLVRVDAMIDYRWRNDTPDPAIQRYTFSIRWTGQVSPRFTGKYYFYLDTALDDAANLWLGGTLLVDGSKPPIGTTDILNQRRGTMDLVAGQKYDLKIEYRHVAGDAAIHLQWGSSSGPEIKAVIPPTQLYPGPAPEVTATPEKCANGALLCEGFEGNGLDGARWLLGPRTYYHTELSQVAIDLDGKRMKNGKRGLRVRQMGPKDDRDGFIKTVTKFPLGSGRLWVRYFVYIETPTPNRWFPVFFAWDGAKKATDADHAEFMMGALVPQSEMVIAPSVHEISSDSQYVFTNQLAPTGKWACYEHEIRGDTRELVLYVDGQHVAEADVSSSYAPATLQFWFGFNEGHEDIIKHPDDGYFDVWFDDIAVSTARLGCTP